MTDYSPPTPQGPGTPAPAPYRPMPMPVQRWAAGAERGSKLRGLSLTRSRVPVGVRVSFGPLDVGCRVEIRVEDRWRSAGRTSTAVAVYAEVFTEVLTLLDEKLTLVDPKAAPDFPLW